MTKRLMLMIAILALPGMLAGCGPGGREGQHEKSMDNMHELSNALWTWADEHNGRYPQDLGVLVTDGQISDLSVFDSPAVAGEPPDKDMSTKEKAKWVRKHSDYIFVAGGSKAEMHSDKLLMHERLTEDLEGGVSVLYGDGRVVFVEMEKAKTMFNISRLRSGERQSAHRGGRRNRDRAPSQPERVPDPAGERKVLNGDQIGNEAGHPGRPNAEPRAGSNLHGQPRFDRQHGRRHGAERESRRLPVAV